MLEDLKRKVLEANLALPRHGLVTFTWGNASAIDRELGLVVIKPSGVEYDKLREEDFVVLDLDGNIVEGELRPSSDTPTHLELYKAWNDIGGIVHTHSTFATSWAQAEREIPVYGTTHADYFYGRIPLARSLSKGEIDSAYEKNTGKAIIERFASLDHIATPGVLCSNHGPFSWGKDIDEAVYNAVVMEEVAKMATLTQVNNPECEEAPSYLIEKHYMRKHGANAYYGQRK